MYGDVDRAEALATIRAAAEAGITLFDLAPIYGPGERAPEAELLVAEAFGGRIPPDVLVTSKVLLQGSLTAEEVRAAIRSSVEASLRRFGRERLDLFFLHSYVRTPDVPPAKDTVTIELVREVVRPEFERLQAEGLIAEWGLTGAGHPRAICRLLAEAPRPAAVQCVTNPLDAMGNLWPFAPGETPDNARIRATAVAEGVAVMGIRALAAGALADTLDRPVALGDPVADEYERSAGFRALAAESGCSAASLAYRYALSLPDVATLVAGAKTRPELEECLAAAAAGPLAEEELRGIERACAPAAGAAV